MADVINLNRFRKKKAKLEKEKRAETNRRFHGRTREERAREDALKRRIEDKLDGAFLVRESVSMDDIPAGSDADDFELLEAAASKAIALKELSDALKADNLGVVEEAPRVLKTPHFKKPSERDDPDGRK